MSTAMTAQLVTDALVITIWRRGEPHALLHHSDRSSQYTSEQFRRLMAALVHSVYRKRCFWRLDDVVPVWIWQRTCGRQPILCH
jgi:putative transposase